MNYLRDTLEYLTKLFQWWIIVQPWEGAVRTRFGKNAKLLLQGTHFRMPFFDTFYIQTSRLRVISMSPQTVTSKDGKTITVVCAIGYSIENILTLYNTLSHPEVTIGNIAQGEIADYIAQNDIDNCSPGQIEKKIFENLYLSDYGIKYEYVKLVGYAVVKTYRLIQDSHWVSNELNTHTKSE